MRETKIKTNQIDYDFDGHGGGGASSVQLLSITTAPEAPFKAGDKFYSNEETEQFDANVIYKAVVDNSWEYAEALTPELGVFYIFDGETYLYDEKIESLFKIGDSTSSNELYILNQTLPANTTTLTTEVDFSENFLINVYVNGLLQSKDLHYYVSGTDIIFTSTFEEAVNVIILYTSSSDVNINNTPTGTVNYNELINKPKINNIELSGNKTSEDLDLQEKITEDNKLEISLVNGVKEFVVTPEIFEKYKVKYWNNDLPDGSTRYLIHGFRMIADELENIQNNNNVINLNDYEMFFDGIFGNDVFYDATFRNITLVFKNGTIVLDNPGYDSGEEGIIDHGDIPDPEGTNNGCGQAFRVDNSNLTFINCIIEAPYSEAFDNGLVSVKNNSIFSFSDCIINGEFVYNFGAPLIGLNKKDPYEDYEQEFEYGTPTVGTDGVATVELYSDEMRRESGILNIIKIISPNLQGTDDCDRILVYNLDDNNNEILNMTINGGEDDDNIWDHIDLPDGRVIHFIHPDNFRDVGFDTYNVRVVLQHNNQDVITFNGEINLVDEYPDVEPEEQKGSNLSVFHSSINLKPRGNNIGRIGWEHDPNRNLTIDYDVKYWWKLVTEDDEDEKLYTCYLLKDENSEFTLDTLPDLDDERWVYSCRTYYNFFSGRQFFLGFNPMSNSEYWKGGIFDCQINIDNDEFFNLATASEGDEGDFENNGCSENDGVYTGFSEENYLKIYTNIPEEFDNIEITIGAFISSEEMEGEDIDFDNALICTTNSECYLGISDEDGFYPNFYIGEGENISSSFGFVKIDSENCNIFINDVTIVNIENFNMNEEYDNELYFIKTNNNKNVKLDLFNSNITVKGNGENNVLNINVDNTDCNISNNTFNGTINLRDESSNTILDKEFPFTLNENEGIWNAEENVEVNEYSLEEFTLVDSDLFKEKVDYEKGNYRFFIDENDNHERGWRLRTEEYETEDFVDLQEYGIEFTGDIYTFDLYNWGEIYYHANIIEYFKANQEIEVTDIYDPEDQNSFWSLVERGILEESYPNVNNFKNNSYSEINGNSNFFKSSGIINVKGINLNGKYYENLGSDDSEIYYIQNEGDFASLLDSALNNNCNIIDLKGREIVCDYIMENYGDITIRNGSITTLEGWNPIGDEDTTRLFKFHNTFGVTFENIRFNGSFMDPDKAVFELEDSNIIFKNCRFDIQYGLLDYGERKEIFRVKSSGLTLNDITGNINAYCPYERDTQEFEEYNKYFSTTFIKTEDSNGYSYISIGGNTGEKDSDTLLRIANDLPDDNGPIEQIFIDDSESYSGISIKDFKLQTHGKAEEWKALIVARDNNSIQLNNAMLGNGSLNIVDPYKTDEYQENHEYNANDRFYYKDSNNEITFYNVRTSYISNNIQDDISNNYIENINWSHEYRAHNVTNTTYGYISNNKRYWLDRWGTDPKSSIRLWNLSDVESNSVENGNENDILIRQNSEWRAISLQELKNRLGSSFTTTYNENTETLEVE